MCARIMSDCADGDTTPELLGDSWSCSSDRLSLLGLRFGRRKPSSSVLQHGRVEWSAIRLGHCVTHHRAWVILLGCGTNLCH